jgi:hypothetical protein
VEQAQTYLLAQVRTSGLALGPSLEKSNINKRYKPEHNALAAGLVLPKLRIWNWRYGAPRISADIVNICQACQVLSPEPTLGDRESATYDQFSNMGRAEPSKHSNVTFHSSAQEPPPFRRARAQALSAQHSSLFRCRRDASAAQLFVVGSKSPAPPLVLSKGTRSDRMKKDGQNRKNVRTPPCCSCELATRSLLRRSPDPHGVLGAKRIAPDANASLDRLVRVWAMNRPHTAARTQKMEVVSR